VLTELVQNAVDHGYPDGASRGDDARVRVCLENDGDALHLQVIDEGVGLPAGFHIDDATGLGLSIVRSLVTSQLEGTIALEPGAGGAGTVVDVVVPLDRDDDAGDERLGERY
jgi:two-component sensor histidine kinase